MRRRGRWDSLGVGEVVAAPRHMMRAKNGLFQKLQTCKRGANGCIDSQERLSVCSMSRE